MAYREGAAVTAERWREIKRVLDLVGEAAPEDRSRLLAESCGADEDLRREAESLLGYDVKAAALDAAAGPSEPAFRLTPGARLGPYEILKVIGAGGMGEVYSARDTRLRRTVALKILTGSMLGHGRSRFEREAQAISNLNHPNICTLYDIGQDNTVDYLVMEYLEGQTLAGRLKDGPLAYVDVLDTAIQIADAMDYAHARGVIHRDVKPGNIMLTERGAKLLDFGLARWRQDAEEPGAGTPVKPASALTLTGALMGTPHYMSPEQIGRRTVDARTDVFALGAVIYEMSTGRKAFAGSSQAEIVAAVLTGEPSDLSSPQPPLPIARKAMRKDPSLRYQSAYEIGADLKRLKRGADSGETSSLRWTSAGIRKRRWAVAASALALVATAAYFRLTRPLPPPQVTGIAQITHTGDQSTVVTDGSRLYYATGWSPADTRIFQISLTGGEPVPFLAGAAPLDISPDRSELLVSLIGETGEGNPMGPYPLGVVSTLGGAPRRLGDLRTYEAHWSPDGEQILYIKGQELHIARSDGKELRKLVAVQGSPMSARWSPDGRTIRFTLQANNSATLWQVSADGSGLHAMFPEWKGYFQIFGAWTPDGKYFIFSAGKTRLDIWALREKTGPFGQLGHVPVQLTHGPMQSTDPVPSADGKRIFFRGRLNLSELVRYDRESSEWATYLRGISATQLDFSRDGKWVAYIDYPGGALWRSTVDGQQRLQLTSSSPPAIKPRWSPEGKWIAFEVQDPGYILSVVPAEGGAVRKLTNLPSASGGDNDPTWSPDGESMVFSANADSTNELTGKLLLGIVDRKTHVVSALPGSEGLRSPRWSPDGRYIAAIAVPKSKPMLYDLATHQQTKLADLNAAWPSWSQDSRFLYVEVVERDAKWCRIRIRDRRVERIVSLAGLNRAPLSMGWIGLTPDGSPITIRASESTEIYALDWEAP